MSSLQVHGTTEICIQAMHLTASQQEVARNCIARYAQPAPIIQKITWLFYRIVQAVKSLFGCSEWQLTRKMLNAQFLSAVYEKHLVDEKPAAPIEKMILEKVVSSIAAVVDDYLSNILWVEEHKHEVSAGYDQRVHQIDFYRVLEKLGKNITKIRSQLVAALGNAS